MPENAPQTPATPTPTPSAVRARVMLPADIGHPIRAAVPLAALAQPVPAATGTGGVTDVALPNYALSVPAMKDHELLVGMIMDTKQGDARANYEVALKRHTMILPMIEKRIVSRCEVERHAASLNQTAGTLYRYLRQYKLGGVQALAPAFRKDKGEARTYLGAEIDKTILESRVTRAKLAEITAEMIKVVRGLWAQNTRESCNQVSLLAAAHLHHLLINAGMPEGAARLLCKQKWAVPRRFVKAEKQYSVIALADRDSKGFYDLVCTSVNRSRAQLEPGDVVFGDVSPCDIPIRRPDGTQGWARLIAWRDAASNWMHVTGYLADKGEAVRREHVALSFANMCEHSPWGLPKRLYLDNGNEYNWMEMLNAWGRLTTFTGAAFGGAWLESGLDAVGKIWRTEPYKPRAKLIESGFSQLLWCMSWHPCFADSDRMTKKTRALGKPIDATDQADVAQFVAESVRFYNAMPQGGQHMQGRSPADMMAEFQARGYRRVVIDSDALALSFAETDKRRVHAGQVQFGGWTYYAPQLLAYDDVDVNVSWARHTPDAAYVFDLRTHQFIGAALPMPVFGFSDVEGAKTAKRLASQARKVVDIMRGHCAWIEPRELMNEFANMSGISLVLDEAKRGERRVEIDAHGRAMVEARNAAVLAAIAKADATVLEPDMVRMNDGETAEEAEARRMFG
ncbi:Mu transposase C-terminal domain-containing protein [Rhodoferax sp.]|uniref:Mu transposase C-terminal domain-containing protein n=1 Tax=Rhodoferax sp. TaxID=50421 RepID=UPI00260DB2B4|nr:Mu transposase C-terminal domain-containing protein [Rhodoferax sp.]MDD3938017.1 hypothetical protein [Rhodoferax sp.]